MPFKNFVVTIDAPDGQQRHTVSVNPMTIGRSYSVDLPLSLSEVSRNHMKIYFKEGQVYVEDLGSKNGSFLNGKQLDPYQPVLYRDGDKVTLGTTPEVLTFLAHASDLSEKSQSRIDFSFDEELAPPPPPVAPASSQMMIDSVSAVKAKVEKVMPVEVAEESFVSKKTDLIAEKWQEWDEKKKILEQELASLMTKAEEAAGESKIIEGGLQALRAQKSELEVQVQEQQKKLNFVQAELKTADKELKSRKDEMHEEQAGLRKELQLELQKMKTVFDTRKVELDQLKAELSTKSLEAARLTKAEKEKSEMLQSFDEKYNELKKGVAELTEKKTRLEEVIVNKEKFIEDVKHDAEELFVERQNELLKEQERVTNLAEKRTLEVEMEMAELKIRRLQDLELQLNREKATAEEDLKRRSDGLALQLTTLIQQRIKARIKEGPLREGLQHLCEELPLMIRDNFEGGSVPTFMGSEIPDRDMEVTVVASKPLLEKTPEKESVKAPTRPQVLAPLVEEIKKRITGSFDADELSPPPVPFYRRPLIQIVSGFAIVLAISSPWLFSGQVNTLNFASLLPASESYTDRILKSTSYMDFERDTDWQKRWVQELNSVLVVQNGVDPAAVRKFVAEERSLVIQLEQEKASGDDPESVMREKEVEFERRAAEILGDKKTFTLVKKVKNDFYRQFSDALRTE